MIKEIKYNRLVLDIDRILSDIKVISDTVNNKTVFSNYILSGSELFWSHNQSKGIHPTHNFNEHFNEHDHELVIERIKNYFKLNDYIWSEK